MTNTATDAADAVAQAAVDAASDVASTAEIAADAQAAANAADQAEASAAITANLAAGQVALAEMDAAQTIARYGEKQQWLESGFATLTDRVTAIEAILQPFQERLSSALTQLEVLTTMAAATSIPQVSAIPQAEPTATVTVADPETGAVAVVEGPAQKTNQKTRRFL